MLKVVQGISNSFCDICRLIYVSFFPGSGRGNIPSPSQHHSHVFKNICLPFLESSADFVCHCSSSHSASMVPSLVYQLLAEKQTSSEWAHGYPNSGTH